MSIVALVFGGGVFWQIYGGIQVQQTPVFDFQFEGVLEPGIITYEVTQELIYVDSLLSNSQIIVSANYKGDKYSGPVIVKIIPAVGSSFEVARWDDFRTSHQQIRSFTLSPADLFTYSDIAASYPALAPFQNDVTENRVGRFDIEIFYNNQPLGDNKETVTVINTPWTHSVQLSDSSIVGSKSITAYVMLKNLGGPSQFNIVGLLYESTNILTPSLQVGSEGWWPGKTWKYTDHKVPFQTKVLGTNQETKTELSFSGNWFEEERIYLIETYAVKKLPYVKFSDGGDWINSDENWRVRDQPHYSTVVVLTP